MLFDDAPRNMIGRIDGVMLFAGAVLFTLYTLKHNNSLSDQADDSSVESHLPMWKAGSYLALGIGVLFV
jgi:hypothetical protein